MFTSKPYKISEIKTLIENIKLFRIKSNLNPKPGQFLELSIPGIGEAPFASAIYNKNYIELIVKKVGNVTTAMFQLKKNDSIYIRGPYGLGFPLNKLKNKNLILVAGGTGIVPIFSLIDYIEKNRKQFKNIYIYFGFRNENYIILKEHLKNLEKRFKVTITLDKLSNPKLKTNYELGFIQETIEKHKPKTKNTIAIICGPEPMMQSVTEELNKLNLPKNKIYWSMERRMECGFGSCGRCQLQDVYVCRDGPIFRYDIIKPKLENEKSANEVK